MPKEKELSLVDIVSELKGKHSDEVILNLAEDKELELKLLPTEILGLDYIIGRPGIPLCKITQIAGDEDSGKSLLLLTLIIKFQKYYPNSIPLLIDTESNFDKAFFKSLGGDLSRLVVATPRSVEKAFDVFENFVTLVRKKYGQAPHILCCIDSLSVAAEKELEESDQPGIHARLLSKFFRVVRPSLRKWNASLIYISQNKKVIGKFAGGVARLGGKAVEFAPILTIDLKRIAIEKNSEGETIGIIIKATATKNHISVPFKSIELYFSLLERRFVNGYNLFLIAKRNKLVIPKDKGWYEFKGKKYRLKDLMLALEKEEGLEQKIREEMGLIVKSEDLLNDKE